MAFSASFQIGSQFLAGNPIPLTISITPGYSIGYRVTDASTSAVIFEGTVSSITGTQTVNINKLFNLTSVGSGIKTYTVQLVYEDTVLQSASISVYPGAISKRLHRELSKNSLNIFNTKLNPTDQNFLLSTRSFSKFIFIPEDELLPIPFYASGKSFTVFGNNVSLPVYSGVSYLNISALRNNNFTYNGAIVSAVQIMSGGSAAVTVIITEADQAHDHFIKYRNSLGAQEMIALENVIDFIPSFDANEIDIFDRLTGDVVQVPFSVSYKGKYTARLRNLRSDETLMAMDMLLSREQFLVTPEGEFQVRVKADDQIFQTTSGAPLKINVSIESIEEERYYSPIDMERLGFIYENIFTSEFTLQYT